LIKNNKKSDFALTKLISGEATIFHFFTYRLLQQGETYPAGVSRSCRRRRSCLSCSLGMPTNLL